MKNCVENVTAVDYAVKNAKKIGDILGKVKTVFPPYKNKEDERKVNYKALAEALARKNLAGYDGLERKTKQIAEVYELACALHDVAEEFLKEITEVVKSGHKRNFLAAACIL